MKYAHYTNSGVEWIGPVPQNWEIHPLFVYGGLRKSSNRGMLEDNLLSLSYGKIVRRSIDAVDGLLPESFETYQVVDPGDMVFRLTDLQNDWRSLRSAKCNERGIITSAYVVVRPKNIDEDYFNYLMRFYDLSKVFYSLGSGLRQSLKFSDIKRLPIIIPSITEQQQIVRFLDYESRILDELIQRQEKLIRLLREKRSSIVSSTVINGLRNDVPKTETGIKWLGAIPKHWSLRRFKQLFRQQKRQGFPELEVLSVYREFGVIIKASRDDNHNATPENLSVYQLVEKDDLVINKMKAWQGSLGISKHNGITSPDYLVYVPTHSETPRFLHYLLRAQHMASVYRSISNGIRFHIETHFNQIRTSFCELTCIHPICYLCFPVTAILKIILYLYTNGICTHCC
ncbi:MAG TPA: restriction endonuclease [Gimesia maris]|uniref:Restriction endonuclease n=1 Tax=Gimesia maris TaxID=122 RepID=A0A3D3RG07_9PLAN|nr:restriction endonuclease [Gimesia maris]